MTQKSLAHITSMLWLSVLGSCLVTSACSSADLVVTVHLAGTPSGAQNIVLKLRLDGKPARQLEIFSGREKELYLQLGQNDTGTLDLDIDAVDCHHCVVGHATKSLRVEPAVNSDVSITIDPNPLPQCQSGILRFPRWNYSPMIIDRGAHTGQVFIAGGTDSNPDQGALATEWYDVETGRTQIGVPLLFRGDGAPPLRLTHGEIFFAGGYDYKLHASLNSVQIYDPLLDRVRPAASMNISRNGQGSVVLKDGRVLVVGGKSGSPLHTLKSAEIYDPVYDTWTQVDDMSYARQFAQVLLMPDGKALVVGGADWPTSFPTLLELFDPAAPKGSMWSAVGHMQKGRNSPRAFLLPRGQVLVAGGVDIQNMLQDVELIDLTHTPDVSIPVGQPRDLIGYASMIQLPGGAVLVSGGGDETSAHAGSEIYDPVQNIFNPGPSLVTARGDHASVVLPDDRVLILGGRDRLYSERNSEVMLSTEYLYLDTCP